MIIWVRNIVIIIFILSAIYILLSTSGRLRQRRRLNSEYKANKPETNKEDFIEQGLVKYDRSMKPKLFLFVYIIPIIIIGTLIFLAQYS